MPRSWTAGERVDLAMPRSSRARPRAPQGRPRSANIAQQFTELTSHPIATPTRDHLTVVFSIGWGAGDNTAATCLGEGCSDVLVLIIVARPLEGTCRDAAGPWTNVSRTGQDPFQGKEMSPARSRKGRFLASEDNDCKVDTLRRLPRTLAEAQGLALALTRRHGVHVRAAGTLTQRATPRDGAGASLPPAIPEWKQPEGPSTGGTGYVVLRASMPGAPGIREQQQGSLLGADV
ncbi:hypothetical protein CB1_001232009 [Camelus ferus]|nr:hypothetical protein CB1_001232009 [Camelus ferus]